MAADFIRVGVSGKGPVQKYIARHEALVPKGATMAALVSGLNIPEGLRVICMRDGRRMPPATKLHDGDNVLIISLLSGG